MTILVTGGAGYIGSHTCVELLNQGYDIIVIDNLENSNIKAIERIKLITNKDFIFVNADIRDKNILDKVFKGCPRGYDPMEVDEFLDAIIKDYLN